MEEKIYELYQEFSTKSEVSEKWHGSFTSKYIRKAFEDKFGKEFFDKQSKAKKRKKKGIKTLLSFLETK